MGPMATDGPLFWDRNGEPLDTLEYGRLFEDPDYRIVARTAVPGGEVVTAWIGAHQGPLDSPRPLIFGTITRRGDDWRDEHHDATEAEALDRHWRAVGAARGEPASWR